MPVPLRIVYVALLLAGVGTNGYLAITGRYPPVGPYRRAAPPRRPARVVAGGIAVLMASFAAWVIATGGATAS